MSGLFSYPVCDNVRTTSPESFFCAHEFACEEHQSRPYHSNYYNNLNLMNSGKWCHIKR